MDRTTARAAAMRLLYEWEMGGDGGLPTRENLLGVSDGENETDYMERMFEGAKEHVQELDALISKFAVGWTIARITRVDLSILRLALYEMLYTNTPVGVVINEAVELSSTYSTPEAATFINGLLGNVHRVGGGKT